MAVKYAILVLNICILFNICNCGEFPNHAKKYDNFDWKLFQTISTNSNKNTFTSPFSIKLFLTIMREAAEGFTRNEIENVLSDLPKESNGLDWFESVISSLEKNSTLYELKVFTQVILDKDLTPNKTFMDTAEKYFHTKTLTVDFKDKKHTAKLVSDVSSDNSRGVIKELATKHGAAGLTNAIYFKGVWQHYFNKIFTKKVPFFKNNGKFVYASMMNKQDSAYFLETSKLGNGAKLLRLPYKGGKLAITFILPNERYGLDEVIASIKPGLIGELQNELKNVTVDIFMPKFTFRSKFSFKNTLQALNIKHIFTDDAQLPGFGSNRTALDDVSQMANIKVDEEGTEVTVISGAEFTFRSAKPPTSHIFRADHPFAFFIEDESSGVVLFVGKVLDPTAF